MLPQPTITPLAISILPGTPAPLRAGFFILVGIERLVERCEDIGRENSLDLFLGIAKGAKHPIVETGPAALVEKVRADIFPHDLFLRRHLEDATMHAFTDQRIPVREALRAGNVRAEEIEQRLVGILPYDRTGARIDLDDSRERRRMIAP